VSWKQKRVKMLEPFERPRDENMRTEYCMGILLCEHMIFPRAHNMVHSD
jgi:hypothetical protein